MEKERREEVCRCDNEDCEKCDPDWKPGIDTCDEDSEDSDDSYDSDDSMDDVYEGCGLTPEEKKQLQDELDYLIEKAETCCPNCEEVNYTHEEQKVNLQQK